MSNKSIQQPIDRKTEQVPKSPLIFMNSVAIFISFLAMIFLLFFPFAVWWYGGLIGEMNTFSVIDFGLEFPLLTWFSTTSLFLFLIFFLCFVMSLLLLLDSLGKITLKLPIRKLGLLGFIPSYAALIFTVTLAAVFVRYSDGHPWGLSFCFYSSLIGSLILILLFIIQLRSESIFRRSGINSQTGF
ncbi:MAG: hypothetical protein ACTSPI_12980 [Candidatus Heimdallarchaeaceae archaeon]